MNIIDAVRFLCMTFNVSKWMFHGWTREFVESNHIKNSGYLEIAEANGIIMVFPQVLSSNQSRIGCYDTFGVTGPLYGK